MTSKATLVAFFTAIGAFLGWRSIMALVLVALMCMDYISGTLAARKNGTWKSSTAREGLWHKGGMILVVLAALIADSVMLLALPQIPIINIAWPTVLFPMVLAWYIITEMGSILENAIRIGAKVPLWLVKILDASLKTVNTAGGLSSQSVIPQRNSQRKKTKTSASPNKNKQNGKYPIKGICRFAFGHVRHFVSKRSLVIVEISTDMF